MRLLVDENINGKVFEPGFKADRALFEILRDLFMISHIEFVEIFMPANFVYCNGKHSV